MRSLIKIFSVSLVLVFSISIFAVPSQINYPHWNFNNKLDYQKLVRIDNFINANKNKGNVAAFDWDGTLYSEQIPLKNSKPVSLYPGDLLCFSWAANHLSSLSSSNPFPMLNTEDNQYAKNILHRVDYFFGRTHTTVQGYNLFSQLAVFEAGMTPKDFDMMVTSCLKVYPTTDYAFLPMLDVMQHMVDSGFKVWIVTAGNPYYVAIALKNIENTMHYTSNKNYNFNLTSLPYDSVRSQIIGNMAKLLKNGRFSTVYDGRFVHNLQNRLFVVDGKGKQVAIQNYIEHITTSPTVFYAGNSDGDYWAMKYVVKNRSLKTLAIAVNPRGKQLKRLVRRNRSRIVVLKEQSKIYFSR